MLPCIVPRTGLSRRKEFMTDEAQSAPKLEDLRELQRRVHSAAQPFIKLKVDIMKRALPTMRLYPDGHFESSYPPEIVELLAKIDALWHEKLQRITGRIYD